MIHHYKKSSEWSNFFKDKHLIFRELEEFSKTPEELAQEGGKEWREFKRAVRKEKRQEKREGKRMQREEVKARRKTEFKDKAVQRRMDWLKKWNVESEVIQETKSRLQKLHEELDQKQEARNLSDKYHTERRASRDDLERSKTIKPESLAAARQAIETQGVMSIEEMKRMETTQNVISKHYMNPAFMLYMNTLEGRKPLNSKNIYDAFDTILSHPYAFEYAQDDMSDSIVVKKRRSADFKDIPNVSLKLATKGFVEQVNGRTLTNPKGELPWEGADYQKKMADYEERFNYEWGQNFIHEFYAGPEENQTEEEFNRLKMEALKKITPEMQEIFVLNQVQIPKAFLRLVDARNLDFEKNDPRIQLLRQMMEKQGTTYEELTQNYEEKLEVMVQSNPAYPNAYVIVIMGDVDKSFVIHKEGYLMNEIAKDEYHIDPRYQVKLKENYFKKEAEKGKDAELLATMANMAKELDNGENQEIRRIMDNVNYMRPVEVALSKAPWEKYKEIALTLTPEADQELMKERLDNATQEFLNNPGYQKELETWITDTLTKAMRENHEVTDIAAQILGVELSN